MSQGIGSQRKPITFSKDEDEHCKMCEKTNLMEKFLKEKKTF